MPVNETVLIDLDQIVKSRFGEKKVPQFILNWLKRFIHQDHLNGYLKKGYLGVEFAEKSLEYYDVHVEVEGLDNLPDEGRFTFAGNHPLGGIDALSVIGFVGRKYQGKIVVPANDFLMAIKPIAEYTIPVNKMGGQSTDLIRQINEAFNSDRQVIIFPAGLCSRKIDGIVQDLPWKKTFITKSRMSQRDIVPVWFTAFLFSRQTAQLPAPEAEYRDAHAAGRTLQVPTSLLPAGIREAHSLADLHRRKAG